MRTARTASSANSVLYSIVGCAQAQGFVRRWFVSRLLGATVLALFGLMLPLSADPPAGYYNSANGLTGPALKAALNEIIDDHTVIIYDQLFPPLRVLWEDPANSANILPVYGSASVGKTVSGWNREHLWPQSRGVDPDDSGNGADMSDLFHVVPADSNVNSRRSNLYFDNSSALDGGVVDPAINEAPLCTRDENSWEPPDNEKGDIARALFYMAVRYDGVDADTTDLELTNGNPTGALMGRLDTLIQWHLADPPDVPERTRNDLIFANYQHNRNPFVDHPEWVSAIWGNGVTTPTAQALSTDSIASEEPVTPGKVTVELGTPANVGGLTVAFSVSGTAQRSEYSLAGNSLTYDSSTGLGSVFIAAGDSSAVIAVLPILDALTEAAETSVITIAPGAGYSVTGTAATVSIADTPPAPPAGVLATWAFDASGFPSPLPSDTGVASLDLSTWNGDIDSFGTGSNQALALIGSPGNGSSIELHVSTVGWKSINVTFQTRGTATGFSTGTWSWSSNGSAFTAVAGNTATTGASFIARTVDFSGITALNNSSNVVFRYTLSGATSTSGNNRIEDLHINGTALPKVSIAATDASGKEKGSDTITFALTSTPAAPAGGLSVVVALTGTATPGTDYTMSGTSSFNPGAGTATVLIPAGATGASFQAVPVVDANPIEFNETIIASVPAIVAAAYAPKNPSSATATISDDTPYNPTWIARFPGITPAQALPSADFDADGLTTLQEFAADANPLVAEPDVKPILGQGLFADPGAGGSMQSFATFTFIRRADANAPTYMPQSSPTLASWTSDLVIVAVTAGPTSASERVTFRSPVPFTGPAAVGARYFRLQVMAAP